MIDLILRLVTQLFIQIQSFNSENWVFDMYIPRTHRWADLIDINPFTSRTDPAGGNPGHETWGGDTSSGGDPGKG
jgi:D123